MRSPNVERAARQGRPAHRIEHRRSSPQLYRRMYEQALLARSLGISVLPPREDGTKAPLPEPIPETCEHPDCVADRSAGRLFGWRHRQHRRAGGTIIERWYLDEHHKGIGVVCGQISGGLLLIEFEGRAVKTGVFDDFLDAAEEGGLGDVVDDIREGYEEESPSEGIHWLIVCDDPSTEKLASTQEGSSWAPLIETKGEGGFAIIAPTSGDVHPSGRPWKLLRGGLDTIIHLDPDELDALFALARQFDKKPSSEFKPPKRSSTNASGRPGDDFNERADWGEILNGWKYLRNDSEGRQQWCRPGKRSLGTSATISPDGRSLYVFSTSTPFEANRYYSKFAAHAVLNHSSDDGVIDWGAASRELARQGYGPPLSTTGRGEVVTVRMSDVEVEPVDFAWDGWIAFGKLSLLVADPELGKSTMSFDLAARISTGRRCRCQQHGMIH